MANDEQPDTPAGLIYWIGMACERARMATTPSFKRSRVAGELGRGEQVVIDFERGKHVPRELDDLLTIYGRLTDRDPRDLLQDAVDLWRKEGAASSVKPRDEERWVRRLPKPPRPPDRQSRKASDARPKKRRKAS